MLGGCARRSSNIGKTVGQANLSGNTTTFTSTVPTSATLTSANLNAHAVAHPQQQAQTLPEAGRAHPAVHSPARSAPTALPPTPTHVRPAPTQTALPVKNSPTREPHSKPDVPTRLIIPAIGLDAPVVAVGWSMVDHGGHLVSEWDVPEQRAAGWLNSSALIGARGNSVLVGHQNIGGRVFEDLEYLKQGDEIQVQAGSETHKYVVVVRNIVPEKDQPLEVRRENAKWIGPSNDARLTLVTCWPRNDNTHRLILVALPVQ